MKPYFTILTRADTACDDFVARQFGGKPRCRGGIKWYWWVTALILVILMIVAGWKL